jgi:hypothetical protein
MAAKVFISYRRDDSRYQAREIHRAFCQVLPRDHVFMDIDTISPGANFPKILKGWVNQCEVLLALIGPGWIDANDPKTNSRRLDNPKDFVRVEIGEALARGIPVVPVLLDGTPMSDVSLLPDDLKGLVDRQAEFLEYRTFDTDVERLIRKLGLAAPDLPPQGRHATEARTQPVKPWVLPLIGASAASLPTLAVLALIGANLNYALYHGMIYALYGGAAGMLIRRFGILKAVAIPIVPAVLLLLSSILTMNWGPISLGLVGRDALIFVQVAFCVWLALSISAPAVRT